MERGRVLRGFGWGVVSTIAMSIPMIVGFVTGLAPMPKPIPAAIVGTVLGEGIPRPLLLILAAGSHLVYGGFWGAVLAGLTRPVTIAEGLGLGTVLWLLMGIAFLPFVGWGLFGFAVAPAIALATLVLHLIYGDTLGWVADREQAAAPARPTSTADIAR